MTIIYGVLDFALDVLDQIGIKHTQVETAIFNTVLHIDEEGILYNNA